MKLAPECRQRSRIMADYHNAARLQTVPNQPYQMLSHLRRHDIDNADCVDQIKSAEPVRIKVEKIGFENLRAWAERR